MRGAFCLAEHYFRAMQTPEPIINKAAQRAIVTIDLADYTVDLNNIATIDVKQYLFKELILKEADFREAVKNTDWSVYKGRYVSITCSSQAIVPMWAYMVLAAELSGIAKDVAFAPPEHAADVFLYRNIASIKASDYEGKRVVIKGCGDKPIPEAAYVQITRQLAGSARAINYGEACSMVPVFKK